MTSIKKSITNLAEEVNTPKIRFGYLAEDYDGLSQYVLVSLSRGSSSAALARVSIGGGAYKFPLENGALVSVVSINGVLEVISLGG
jgi:hypothetical protein